MASKFSVYQNRHDDIEFTYKVDGTAQDISTAELIFAVYKKRGDGVELITKANTAAGGADAQIGFTTDGSDGAFQVHFLPSDTVSLDREIYYHYEIRMILSSKTKTIGEGQFKLKGVSI